MLPGLSFLGTWLLLLSWHCCILRSSTAVVMETSDRFDDYYRFEDGHCEYYQLIEPGNKSYYLYSPGYPNPYRADQVHDLAECRWFAKTSSLTDRLVLDCHEFDLPESSFCEADSLTVSRVGDANFADGVKHCGPRSFTTISRTNKMNIKFVMKRYSKGGRFMCSVGAKRMDFRIPETVKNSQFCECGEQDKGVFVNEKTTDVSEFPLFASLIDGQTADLFCGATIISKHHALTAARCLADTNSYQIALLVGDHDIITLSNDVDPAMLVVITEVYIHPLFNPSSVEYDLAIVETQDEIPFSSKVGPACLPFKHINNDFVGDIVRVLGWGSADFDDSVSGSLQKSHLKVTSMSQCTDKYKTNTDQDHFCTIYLSKANTCQVDSGGPLLWADPATGKLNIIGVVSNKFVCTESTPSVQTRLATVNNLNWIKVILTGQYYCS